MSTMIVDARTIYEPHAKFGMKSRTSMMKAPKQTKKVMIVKTKKASR
jgi:hypothetical protein